MSLRFGGCSGSGVGNWGNELRGGGGRGRAGGQNGSGGVLLSFDESSRDLLGGHDILRFGGDSLRSGGNHSGVEGGGGRGSRHQLSGGHGVRRSERSP